MASILNVDQINNAAGTSAVTIDASTGKPSFPNGAVLPAGSVIQVKRFEPPVTSASVTNYVNGQNVATTSNTTSLWTANFTPLSSSSKILGIYQTQEDGQGTGGWTVHSCFVGSTLINSTMRFLRESVSEPYSQGFTFEYTHGTTSQITFDMRYGSTAAILILLNRTNGSTNSSLRNSTSLTLMEIAQ